MEQGKIVLQVQFSSLEAFVAGMNNYCAHFYRGNTWAETRRSRPHFIRFKEQNPEMERDLTDKVTAVMTTTRKMEDSLLQQLWDSYNIMSQLVYADDPGVRRYSHSEMYLTS